MTGSGQGGGVDGHREDPGMRMLCAWDIDCWLSECVIVYIQ
jgi:hypothetical protein